MLKKLQLEVPNGKFVIVECDLQDFTSVRNAIQEIKSNYSSIYCLANNAGIMATPDRATIDGYDTQMQTNHLSHFLLTAELFPLLEAEAEATGDARIVNHSSLGRHYTPNKGLEEKYFKQNGGKLGGDELKVMGGACFHRYFQSKLANSVFTYGLHNKLQAKNSKVRSVCAHPGGSDTNLSDHMSMGRFWDSMMGCMMPLLMQTAEDGTMGLIKGMLDPAAKSGALYGPKNSGTKGKAVSNPPKEYENDPKAIEMLWQTSEDATAVIFEI
jgi:NAD(P)-dependent dehydrogenase (short-subunit alcohol dehydrogenase family)